jgi:hypothetical protein
MGTLLLFLSIRRGFQEEFQRIEESFSKGALALMAELAKEVSAVILALLLVAFFVAFFYLYCLPWGVH